MAILPNRQLKKADYSKFDMTKFFLLILTTLFYTQIFGQTDLRQKIEQIMAKNEKKYFIKLNQRSGKNEIKLFPARSVEDVYKNLL